MINPFDDGGQFTCPWCSSREFTPTFVTNMVRCSGCRRMCPCEPDRPQKDAATIAFDKIVEICGMKTWQYPGQVVRDVQILKDELEKQKQIKKDLLTQFLEFMSIDIGVDGENVLRWLETGEPYPWPETKREKASREALCAALDLLEGPYRDRECYWCNGINDDPVHDANCPAALLLRKHGRKVRVQGEP